MRTPAVIASEMVRIRDDMGRLAALDQPSEVDDQRFGALMREFNDLEAEHRRAVQLDAIQSTVAGNGPYRAERGAFRSDRPATSTAHSEARRVVDELHARGWLPDHGAERVVTLVDHGPRASRSAAAEWLTVAGDPDYVTAWCKLAADPDDAVRVWSDDERAAFGAMRDWTTRAVVSNPDASGGVLIPAVVDPSITLRSEESISPLRRVCALKQIAVNKWTGLSTDGIQNAFEWLPESAEASEGAPTWCRSPFRCMSGACISNSVSRCKAIMGTSSPICKS